MAASDRAGADPLTFATQDLNSLTETETNRLTKLADAIINYHKSPDILAVQGATPAALSLLQSAISTTTLFDRSPLLLTVKIKRRGILDYELTLINASFYPRTDLSSTTLSEETRIHREQQAEQLTTQVLEPL